MKDLATKLREPLFMKRHWIIIDKGKRYRKNKSANKKAILHPLHAFPAIRKRDSVEYKCLFKCPVAFFPRDVAEG